MSIHVPTGADLSIKECIKANRSFALIAGAGSGKTASLVAALDEIRSRSGAKLRQNGQQIACITYTNRAAEVIASRLGFDELFLVSTLHKFLWAEIKRFPKDIRASLQNYRIPALLAKAKEKDTGRETKDAKKAREQILRYEVQLAGVAGVDEFKYGDVAFSDYLNGQLGHDDIIEIAAYLLNERQNFRRILGFRYPYIFVDEAQDTFGNIIKGLNLVCGQEGLPIVGYFGDPWQQIYEGRAGDFAPPHGGQIITKVENFRCSPPVIELLNAFRDDVQQVPAGDNRNIKGSVGICLVQAEEPSGDKKRYSDSQIERAIDKMDQAVLAWGWEERSDVIRLFLVRQMIARRMGFLNLHKLFTGPYASARAQEEYESGEHYLLKPFLKSLIPLIIAYRKGESRKVIDILLSDSPTFNVYGLNANRKLKEMIELSKEQLNALSDIWCSGTTKELLAYCRDHNLLYMPDRLLEQLSREPRQEKYDEELYSQEKGDWLADVFFAMTPQELKNYCDFMLENTAYSTQHGVKGEEYPNVIVVFDDVEASWNQYSFSKLLTPRTSGNPSEGQLERGRKLAYVCFSRARENLRILLFTRNPEQAQLELMENLNMSSEQIAILA